VTVPPGQPQVPDEPMQLANVRVAVVGPGSVLHLPDGAVDAPVAVRRYDVLLGA
jgi:beta-aspartyl-peptidase (threonine type)